MAKAAVLDEVTITAGLIEEKRLIPETDELKTGALSVEDDPLEAEPDVVEERWCLLLEEDAEECASLEELYAGVDEAPAEDDTDDF